MGLRVEGLGSELQTTDLQTFIGFSVASYRREGNHCDKHPYERVVYQVALKFVVRPIGHHRGRRTRIPEESYLYRYPSRP